MLPYTIGGERRLSEGTAGKESGSATGNGTDVEDHRTKPRVTAKDLEGIMDGRKTVPLRMRVLESGLLGNGGVSGGGGGKGEEQGVDMKSVLATLKVASERPKREVLMSAPPY
jgi:hypothetical protein